MGITKEGIEAEQWLLSWLRDNRNITIAMQPDGLAKSNNGSWNLYEIKHQEVFEPPPFKGHGLPKWQVKARLEFYEDTKVRPVLIIKDKKTKEIFAQYLDVLEKNEYFDTKGKKPRRVYNLKYFKKVHEPN